MDEWLLKQKCDGNDAVRPSTKDIYVQLVISAALGLTAFIAFCIMRPRWPSLYAARKRHNDPNIALPVLPDSFLGWIPALYKVTDEQVLASAGLDGFVFLTFFKMAMRLFAVMLFFAVTVLWPINHKYVGDIDLGAPENSTWVFGGSTSTQTWSQYSPPGLIVLDDNDVPDVFWDLEQSYLWSYLAFTWFFTILVIYYMNAETFNIIKIRQNYLGTQSTITDRTFRLTGIPQDLRSEAKIKQFVENLEIGNVQSVTLCRDWSEIDALMKQRDSTLRKLEEAWSVYRSKEPVMGVPRARAPVAADSDTDDDNHAPEDSTLLASDSLRGLMAERPRPTTRIRFGFLNFRSRSTDAIDYYEEKLRRLDEKIIAARKKEYAPTPLAFVTMDSIVACQMAIQALIDPRPGQLLSKPAPAPSDVVWKNTYVPFWRRRMQSWLITIFITVLTLLWIVPVATLAGLLSICTIEKVSPALAEALLRHEISKALVQTALPVLVVSLLNVAVPYLYDYLANQQGTISQGDVELSVISKNFFFTFFNVFLVFAIFGTTSQFWPVLRNSLRDTRYIALTLASSIQGLSNFYLNFIMLQGLGLYPFRLLQFGCIALYPFQRMGAKTPRDFAEIVQPTLFTYGLYLPTSLLVFILCLVYSVLPGCHIILLLGVLYFVLGYFVHKYQLLYSMDQPQHATGGAWRIICYRIILGLVMFQVIMIGILTLRSAFTGAVLVLPLTIITVWYSYYFSRQFTPLTVFIALRSIQRASDPGVQSHPDLDPDQDVEELRLTRRMSTVDEDRERGMRFVNPNLVAPLEQPWIYQQPPPPLSPEDSANVISSGGPIAGGDFGRVPSLPGAGNVNDGGSHTSSFSLGDTHVWRDNGDNNV
ncbi:hypothetical protein BX600DRAFT_432656 [Xylariales sp. PMI_506]|nr:hypothetical protein BX600DRAFT_432656 [Xylariales sp. PMI_506]